MLSLPVLDSPPKPDDIFVRRLGGMPVVWCDSCLSKTAQYRVAITDGSVVEGFMVCEGCLP